MLSTILDNTLYKMSKNLIKEKPELYFQGLHANYKNLLGLAPFTTLLFITIFLILINYKVILVEILLNFY